MKKNIYLWTVLFAFLFGQAIQLVTNAMAHYLYVSDPVMMCITVGIVTVVLVALTAIFTLMDAPNGVHEPSRPYQRQYNDDATIIPPIFFNNNKRKPLDTDQEDIDEIDKNNAKEATNEHSV